MNDAADLLKGVTKEGARGEYIRIVTQLWENSDENGEARPYRRGTLGDGRAMFAERREQLQVSGSDAYIVGSTSSNTGEKFLHEEIDDGVQMIWFNHTVRDNSLTLDMLRTLPRLLQKAADDEDVFATVLTGEGETFCTGLDKDMLASVLQKPGESKADWEARMFEYRTAIEEYVASFITCSKPLIAAVNGSAVGLGATTLALCDLVFASTMTTLHVPDQQLGLSTLGCASYTFPRMMGNSVAADMLLRGARHLVRDSQRHGIVTFVMDDTEASHVLERVLYLMSTLPMQPGLSGPGSRQGESSDQTHK
ncbi:enoyl-CoA delta isomerase 2-like [Sycon ciliatum]|uniref:enoyl-CoA delta isomerase 2-like n=1 Tax=Sycon ciliatum TaxID=27933 RepID=UPI0031F641F1